MLFDSCYQFDCYYISKISMAFASYSFYWMLYSLLVPFAFNICSNWMKFIDQLATHSKSPLWHLFKWLRSPKKCFKIAYFWIIPQTPTQPPPLNMQFDRDRYILCQLAMIKWIWPKNENVSMSIVEIVEWEEKNVDRHGYNLV